MGLSERDNSTYSCICTASSISEYQANSLTKPDTPKLRCSLHLGAVGFSWLPKKLLRQIARAWIGQDLAVNGKGDIRGAVPALCHHGPDILTGFEQKANEGAT